MGQAPKHESQYKITELEAEKGDAKMTLVPCIMALIIRLDQKQGWGLEELGGGDM